MAGMDATRAGTEGARDDTRGAVNSSTAYCLCNCYFQELIFIDVDFDIVAADAETAIIDDVVEDEGVTQIQGSRNFAAKVRPASRVRYSANERTIHSPPQ